jgi:hypothetical protein
MCHAPPVMHGWGRSSVMATGTKGDGDTVTVRLDFNV